MSFNIATSSHRYIPQENCLINNSNSRFFSRLSLLYDCRFRIIAVSLLLWGDRHVICSLIFFLLLYFRRWIHVVIEKDAISVHTTFLIYSILHSTYKRRLEWNAAPIYEPCQNELNLTINFLITFFSAISYHQIAPMTKTTTNHIFNFIFFLRVLCLGSERPLQLEFSLNLFQPDQRLREKHIYKLIAKLKIINVRRRQINDEHRKLNII